MKTLPALLLLSALMAFPSGAAAAPVDLGSLKLRDGRTFEKVKVMKVEPDGLRIEHASGVGKVRLEDLPSAISERFSLDENTASAWRLEEKKRLDAADDATRRAQVRRITEASKAEQDRQAQSARVALFDQARAGDVNYAYLDGELLQLIKIWQEAGREDLAARFEEDRAVLKQQEIARPGARSEAENAALVRRVDQLQNDLTEANNQPPAPAPTTSTTTVVLDSDPYALRRSSYYNSYHNSYPYGSTYPYNFYYPRNSNYYYVPPTYVNRHPPYCPPVLNHPTPYRPPVVNHTPFRPPVVTNTPYCPPNTRIIPATPYRPATVVQSPVRYPTTIVRPGQTPNGRFNPAPAARFNPPARPQSPAFQRPNAPSNQRGPGQNR